MPASRGPVPKRTEERRRRNKGEPVTRASRGKASTRSAGFDPEWHPLAAEWYQSLSKSGQSEYYEASDWAKARITAELISRSMHSALMNGQLMSVIDSMMSSLLTTEGDRRRMRLELAKADPAKAEAQHQAKVAHLSAYRRKASG